MKSHIELLECQDGDEPRPMLVRIDLIDFVSHPIDTTLERFPDCGASLSIEGEESMNYTMLVTNTYESIRNQLAIKRDSPASTRR